MWKDGQLLATYKDGKAHLDAYLDDYAFLLAALLEVLQADFDAADLAWADGARRRADRATSRTRRTAASSSPRTATRSSSIGPKPGPRQRDAFGQRRRRAGRSTASPSSPARCATREAAERHARALLAADAAPARGLRQPARRARGDARAAAHRDRARARARHFAPWREVLDARLPARHARALHPRGRGDAAAAARQAREGAVNAWVCEGVTCLPPLGLAARIAGNARIARQSPASARTAPSQEPPMKKTASSSPPSPSPSPPRPPLASEELAKKNACTACHAIDKKLRRPGVQGSRRRSTRATRRPRRCSSRR